MKPCILWFLLLSNALVLHAAELQVTGTPAASIFIDGEPHGLLPMPSAIELEPGVHSIRVQARGYRSHIQQIVLGDDESASLEIVLTTLHRSNAIGASLLLAGMGQVYEGRPWAGYLFLGAQLAAALTAILAEAQFKDHRDELARAQYAYDQAIRPEEMDYWRQQTLEEYAKLEDVDTVRDTAVFLIAATAVVSALEAWWHFPGVELQASSGDGALRLGLGGEF